MKAWNPNHWTAREFPIPHQKIFSQKKSLFVGVHLGFPGSSNSKESACSEGDPGSISGLGRSPGEGNGHPLLYSCLENSMGRGACWATVHEVAESDMTERLTHEILLSVQFSCITVLHQSSPELC